MTVAKTGSYKIVRVEEEGIFVNKVIANKIQKSIDNLLNLTNKMGYQHKVNSEFYPRKTQDTDLFNKVVTISFKSFNDFDSKTLKLKTVDNELVEITMHSHNEELCFSDDQNNLKRCDLLVNFLERIKTFL